MTINSIYPKDHLEHLKSLSYLEFRDYIIDLILKYCKHYNFRIEKTLNQKEFYDEINLFLTNKREKALETGERKFIFDYEMMIDLREELELISNSDDKFILNYNNDYFIYFDNRKQINKFLYDFFEFYYQGVEHDTSFVSEIQCKLCYIFNLNNKKVIDFRVPDCAGIEIH